MDITSESGRAAFLASIDFEAILRSGRSIHTRIEASLRQAAPMFDDFALETGAYRNPVQYLTTWAQLGVEVYRHAIKYLIDQAQALEGQSVQFVSREPDPKDVEMLMLIALLAIKNMPDYPQMIVEQPIASEIIGEQFARSKMSEYRALCILSDWREKHALAVAEQLKAIVDELHTSTIALEAKLASSSPQPQRVKAAWLDA